MITSCIKSSCDNPVPEITYTDFIQYGKDSAFLVISFKDCDGDIGLTAKDSVGDYKYNLFLDYYEKQNGIWKKLELAIPFYYRIPVLETEANVEALEGDISVNLGSFYYNMFSPYDTFRYDVTLKDRALNLSNSITTDFLVAPK